MSIEVNGVSLPDIPSEVLAQYPYAVIHYQLQTQGDVEALNTHGLCVTEEPLYAYPGSLFSENDAIFFNALDGASAWALYDLNSDGTAWEKRDEWAAEETAIDVLDVDTQQSFTEDGETIVVRMVMKTVWANYTIYHATPSDGVGGLNVAMTATDEVFFAMDDPNYYAPKSWFDGMARQVMRLTGTSDKMNTDKMLELAKGVEMPPDAEDYSFGTPEAGYEYGIQLSSIPSVDFAWKTQPLGWRFTPNEDITIVGLRVYTTPGYAANGKVWELDTQTELAALEFTGAGTAEEWEESLFSVPVTLTAGTTYVVSRYGSPIFTFSDSGIVCSEKITYGGGCYNGSGDVFPQYAITGTAGAVNIMMNTPTEEGGITEYAIQTETLTGIANEVMRISGTATQMTPAQIITALQGVTV